MDLHFSGPGIVAASMIYRFSPLCCGCGLDLAGGPNCLLEATEESSQKQMICRLEGLVPVKDPFDACYAHASEFGKNGIVDFRQHWDAHARRVDLPGKNELGGDG